MKYITGFSAEGWRLYALRMAHYGAELRRAGLAPDHPERVRAREGLKKALVEIKREQQHVDAAARLMTAKKKALGTERGRRIQ